MWKTSVPGTSSSASAANTGGSVRTVWTNPSVAFFTGALTDPMLQRPMRSARRRRLLNDRGGAKGLRRTRVRGGPMPGHIVHFEIPADDTAKGREFWGSLFG